MRTRRCRVRVRALTFAGHVHTFTYARACACKQERAAMTRAAAAVAIAAGAVNATGTTTTTTTVFHLASKPSCSHESGSIGLFYSPRFPRPILSTSAVTREDEVPLNEPGPEDDAHRPRPRGGGGARVAGRALALQPARRNR